ncbi:MAG: cytochrome c biogenesis protein CcdA [Candidatus Bathyarchaeota archaeon]|jgi:cytochrome c biogenesis protein CcdA
MAGVFALLSPCGYPMLPGYISYYLGSKLSVEKALRGGVTCALGLLTVYSIIGIIVSAIGGVISPYIPFLELVAGVAIIVMGVFMIIEIRFLTFFERLRAPINKGLIGLFLYGIVYGLATLGCSAPIFFSIVLYAIVSGGALFGFVTFFFYAVGMSFPILLTTILVAKAKQLMLNKIMDITPLLQKISGLILVGIGIYLIYYYITFLTI